MADPQRGPGPVMTLLLVRHAQCTSNLKNLVSGRSDSVLTDQGLQEAQLLANHLRREGTKIDRIYSSPLLRAYKTALAIAGDRQQIVVDPRLTEKYYGVCEGIPESEMFRQMQEAGSDVFSFIPEGAETPESVQNRIDEFFMSLVNEYVPVEPSEAPSINGYSSESDHEAARRSTVLVVTHGAVMFSFALYFTHLGLHILDEPQTAPISNTGVCRLDFWRDPSGRINGRLVRLNSVDHLAGAAFSVKTVAAARMFHE